MNLCCVNDLGHPISYQNSCPIHISNACINQTRVGKRSFCPELHWPFEVILSKLPKWNADIWTTRRIRTPQNSKTEILKAKEKVGKSKLTTIFGRGREHRVMIIIIVVIEPSVPIQTVRIRRRRVERGIQSSRRNLRILLTGMRRRWHAIPIVMWSRIIFVGIVSWNIFSLLCFTTSLPVHIVRRRSVCVVRGL